MADYKEKFEKMRVAGKLAAQTLDMLTDKIQEGVSTDYIDKLGYEFIRDNGGYSAPLYYRGFTKSLCTSLNHVVCHGIPGGKRLQDGDILNIDVTVILDGWYGDTSRMFWVGTPSVKAQNLTQITYDCLMMAIKAAKPGATLGDIGYIIQRHAESHRFSVVRDFTGHGLGRVFHTAPTVLHYGTPGTGLKLKPGMIFTIEPMINAGHYATKILSDGWTAVTRDKSLSAQFEHSIGITEDGAEIFTLSPEALHHPPFKKTP